MSTFVIIQNKNSSFETVFLPSPKTYINLGYIADLMDAVVGLRELNDSYSKARNAVDRRMQIPPPVAQSTPKPPKDVGLTVERHKLRLN